MQYNTHNNDIHSFGFYRFAAAVPPCTVGDCNTNAAHIIEYIFRSAKQGADTVVFPALTITSASCGDLFSQHTLLTAALQALNTIIEKTAPLTTTAVIGLPFVHCGKIYNTAAVVGKGQIYGLVPLHDTAAWNGFSRYSDDCESCTVGSRKNIPWGTHLLFEIPGTSCSYMVGSTQPEKTAVQLMPLAQPAAVESLAHLERRFAAFSHTHRTAVVFVNAGWGESSTDSVYAGEAGIIQAGTTLAKRSGYTLKTYLAEQLQASSSHSKTVCTVLEPSDDSLIYADIDCQFFPACTDAQSTEPPARSTVTAVAAPNALPPPLYRPLPTNPFIPPHIQYAAHNAPAHDTAEYDNFFLEILEMQARGLVKRLSAMQCNKIILGISGGLDSTLALLIAVIAARFAGNPASQVYALTMPGFGTTSRTKSNAQALSEVLGCTFESISITRSILSHFKDIGHNPDLHTTVYENAQARERTQILMDKANQLGALLIGTGDLSESALGWETYNGDHISMYNVNAGIPKTILKECVRFCSRYPVLCTADEKQQKKCSRILQDILATPISPELLPTDNQQITQKTESILGSYELHDFFLYYILHSPFSPRKIFFLAEQTFCTQEPPRYRREEVLHCLKLFYRRFFTQQFKRSCAPDGVQVGLGSFSPRGAWNMPSDISPVIWLNELENLCEL